MRYFYHIVGVRSKNPYFQNLDLAIKEFDRLVTEYANNPHETFHIDQMVTPDNPYQKGCSQVQVRRATITSTQHSEVTEATLVRLEFADPEDGLDEDGIKIN